MFHLVLLPSSPESVPARPVRFVLNPVSRYAVESCKIDPPVIRPRVTTPPRMQIDDIPRSFASPDFLSD